MRRMWIKRGGYIDTENFFRQNYPFLVITKQLPKTPFLLRKKKLKNRVTSGTEKTEENTKQRKKRLIYPTTPKRRQTAFSTKFWNAQNVGEDIRLYTWS